jgi:wobble nucleotide-excising tRNase
VIDGHESYSWVKYIYIDDPISSLDDNNVITVASDLAQLLKRTGERLRTVISSHHGLFYNVIYNEFRSSRVKYKSYFYHRQKDSEKYTLQTTNDTPFFHHVAMLRELQQAVDSGNLYTHHFNMLRSILEKTATFFGFEDFSACIEGIDDEILYARALNLLSHGKYSVYEPREMVGDTKELFRKIFDNFLARYRFNLPDL